MPDTPAPFTQSAEVELPRELDPLVEELVARFLDLGRARAHDVAVYTETDAAKRVATADARAILFTLRARLDELAPEVATLREGLRDANRDRDEAVRECSLLRDARDDLAQALGAERRVLAAMRTDLVLADARRRSVANYLRHDARVTSSDSPDAARRLAEGMRWAADMLDATDGEGVAI